MFGISDHYGPDDDRSLGLAVGEVVSIRSVTGATYRGRVLALGQYFVDVDSAEPDGRSRVRLASIESVSWPADGQKS